MRVTHAITKVLHPARFLSRAAWRCPTCDTPWVATVSRSKAVQLACDHDRLHHREEP